MGTLITIGDSYMSPVTDEYAGKHFSELIAKELNLNLIPYARGGMSNGGICLQIEAALQQKPDLVLIGLTFTDRIEWPINDIEPVDDFKLEHIHYGHQSSLSTHSDWVNKNHKLISTNLGEVFDTSSEYTFSFDIDTYGKERKDAIKQYHKYLYHPDWKRKIDSWILYSALHRLHLSGIKYVVAIDWAKAHDSCNWLQIDVNYAGLEVEQLIINDITDIDPGFHTSAGCQEKIAELLLTKYLT